MNEFRPIVIFLLILLTTLVGCSRTIPWVRESTELASCVPDAPPTWKDYTEKEWESVHSAQTAVQFVILSRNPPRLQARFDRSQSLVKPNLIHRWFPYDQELSHRLLRHEQLHYAISCLLTRQANAALILGADLDRMLFLLRATAQRLNRQYDKDTKHGTIPSRQAQWETDVLQTLKSIPPHPPKTSE